MHTPMDYIKMFASMSVDAMGGGISPETFCSNAIPAAIQMQMLLKNPDEPPTAIYTKVVTIPALQQDGSCSVACPLCYNTRVGHVCTQSYQSGRGLGGYPGPDCPRYRHTGEEEDDE